MMLFRLRWIFMAMMLPGLIGLVLALSALYRMEQAQYDEHMQQAARMLSSRVDAEIGGEQRALQAFAATTDALATDDLPAIHAHARVFMQASGYGDAMLLIDRQGRQILNTRHAPGAPLPRSANPALSARVFATGQPAVSGIFFGATHRSPLMALAVPVRRAGTIRYSLHLSLAADRLGRMLRPGALQAGWSLLIADPDGIVAVPAEHLGAAAGAPLPAALRTALRGGREGVIGHLMTPQGTMTCVFSRSALTGYVVALLVPQSQVWNLLAGKLLLPSAVLAAIVLCSLWLMHYFARQMLVSLDHLSAAADAAAAGQRNVRVPAAGPAELIRVAHLFNRMILALRVAESAQQRLNRALRLVSECNSLMVHEREEAALLTGVCRLTVESGGYRMAWIGLPLDDAARSVRPVAQSGYEDGYLDHVKISWGEGPLGHGPTGTAIRLRATQINQDYLDNPLMAPWREAALHRGYQSSIALPLCADGQVLGALTIYAREPNAFGAEEVALLEQLAEDLAFGVAAIRTEASYRRVLDHAADAVLVCDAGGRLRYANLQAATMLGCPVDALRAGNVADLVEADALAAWREVLARLSPQQASKVELTLRGRDGTVLPVEVNAIRLPDGSCFAACRDMTERKRFEAELRHLATHDKLTGLVNRQLLHDRIGQAIVHARRDQGLVAAMLLDLDRFKTINDSLTHETGDALLREIAARLTRLFRAGDTVARLGGDEFMVILTDIPSRERVAMLAQRLLETVGQPLAVAGHQIVVTASIGIALFPGDGDSARNLIQNADVAMYRAKELGGGGFQFYAPEMNARMLERLELENDLRRAALRGELELYYQPKMDADGQAIVGAEALVRWNHPVRGQIPPARFIPLAEETGLIQPIGEWILREACLQLQRWLAQGLSDFVLSVNLSVRQLQQEGLVRQLGALLSECALPPAMLELEVTESALMMNPDRTVRVLEALKSTGVRISLDDFGTGYASLSYLKNFPIDTLKIDQSFVRGVLSDANDAAIARLVINLAHDLNMKVVAEGVETDAQLGFLRAHRCDEMQGFYFSRPVPAAAFSSLLREKGHL